MPRSSQQEFLQPDGANPALGAALVTLADSDLPVLGARALYVGSSGNVRVTTAFGDDVVFTGVLAGSILPVSVNRVWLTNTTAGNIVALY